MYIRSVSRFWCLFYFKLSAGTASTANIQRVWATYQLLRVILPRDQTGNAGMFRGSNQKTNQRNYMKALSKIIKPMSSDVIRIINASIPQIHHAGRWRTRTLNIYIPCTIYFAECNITASYIAQRTTLFCVVMTHACNVCILNHNNMRRYAHGIHTK